MCWLAGPVNIQQTAKFDTKYNIDKIYRWIIVKCVHSWLYVSISKHDFKTYKDSLHIFGIYLQQKAKPNRMIHEKLN